MTRYFFIANFINNGISEHINMIKFIAEPTNFSLAHMTLKGPFITKQKKQFEGVRKQIEKKEIEILDVGNFFDYNQNTVFLECNKDEELYQIWKSKTDRTYKTYNPHITIYDGDDVNFSRELYNLLKKYKLKSTLKVDEVDLYSRNRKQEIFYESNLNINLLDILNLSFDNNFKNYFEKVSKKEKLKHIENIVKQISL